MPSRVVFQVASSLSRALMFASAARFQSEESPAWSFVSRIGPAIRWRVRGGRDLSHRRRGSCAFALLSTESTRTVFLARVRFQRAFLRALSRSEYCSTEALAVQTGRQFLRGRSTGAQPAWPAFEQAA